MDLRRAPTSDKTPMRPLPSGTPASLLNSARNPNLPSFGLDSEKGVENEPIRVVAPSVQRELDRQKAEKERRKKLLREKELRRNSTSNSTSNQIRPRNGYLRCFSGVFIFNCIRKMKRNFYQFIFRSLSLRYYWVIKSFSSRNTIFYCNNFIFLV